MDARDQVAHIWCEMRPPGNHLWTREHLRARGGADEGRRVYERDDEPAGVWERHGAARQGSWLDGDGGREPSHAATPAADAPGGPGPPWRWPARAGVGVGVGVGVVAPGADGEGGARGGRGGRGDRGDRGGTRMGQLAEGDGGDRGRARGRPNERGRGEGARAMVAGETGQFAVGHARGALSGAVIGEGASLGMGAAGVLASWQWTSTRGREHTRGGVPGDRSHRRTGRHDGEEGRPGG